MIAHFALVGLQLLVTTQADPVFAGNACVFLSYLEVDNAVQIADLVLYVLHPLFEVLLIYFALYQELELTDSLFQAVQPLFLLFLLLMRNDVKSLDGFGKISLLLSQLVYDFLLEV